MRILLSCLQDLKPHPIPAYRFWRDYFVRGIEETGHEVVEVPGVDWAEGLVHSGDALESWRGRTWQQVVDFVRREQAQRPLDMFLGYLYPQQVDTAAIAHLRNAGLRCVNFFCDNVREFREMPQEYRGFDLHWVPEFEALPLYRRAGVPLIHAAMPCWVPQDFRTVPQKESEGPSFIGSADPLRRALLGEAIAAGANLSIYGVGWQQDSTVQAGDAPRKSVAQLLRNQATIVRQHGTAALATKLYNRIWPLHAPAIPAERIKGTVSGDDYVRISREAVVTIGVNRVPSLKAADRRPLRYSRLRDIEAPMLGACYLAEHAEGLEQMYDIGVEIETYRTAQEMTQKLAALAADEPRRRAMRMRAQKRALSGHSVPRTLTRMQEMLF